MWIEQGKFHLRLCPTLGGCVEIFRSREARLSELLARVSESGDEYPAVTFSVPGNPTPERLRELASALNLAASIASDWWGTYKLLMIEAVAGGDRS